MLRSGSLWSRMQACVIVLHWLKTCLNTWLIESKVTFSFCVLCSVHACGPGCKHLSRRHHDPIPTDLRQSDLVLRQRWGLRRRHGVPTPTSASGDRHQSLVAETDSSCVCAAVLHARLRRRYRSTSEEHGVPRCLGRGQGQLATNVEQDILHARHRHKPLRVHRWLYADSSLPKESPQTYMSNFGDESRRKNRLFRS